MVTTTVEKLSPTRVKLHISVTPDELKPAIAHAYEHIAQDIQIPGFRKGKVPAPIIDQRVGRGAVIEHAVSEGLDGFFREAVTANEVRTVGRPAAEVIEWPNEKDFSGDLKVEVEVDVRPEFELPALDTVTVEIDAVETDEAAVDAELDRLLHGVEGATGCRRDDHGLHSLGDGGQRWVSRAPADVGGMGIDRDGVVAAFDQTVEDDIAAMASRSA